MPSAQKGFAEINGASVYYETSGAGQPSVMLHGHLLDNRQWDDQFDYFSPTHRVVRYDARGHGQSSLPPAPFSHAADLHALLEFLGIEQAVLMGCSGGGGACIDFALEHASRVKSLILVGSSVDGLQPSGAMSPTLMAYVQALQAHDLDRSLELSLQIFTDGPHRRPEQVNPVARERTRIMSAPLFARPEVPEAVPQGLTPPALQRLGEIRPPTLILVGSEDNSVIQTVAALLLNNIPKARSVVIPDAGHHPNLEHPEQFNEIVAKFFSKAEGG